MKAAWQVWQKNFKKILPNDRFFISTLALEKGATIKITTDDAFKDKCTKENLWVDYKNISKVLTPGKRIFIDDGLISIVAKELGPDFVIGEIENGGNLGSRKGCNLPGTDCDLPAVSEKDKSDLLFGVEQGKDWCKKKSSLWRKKIYESKFGFTLNKKK